jgi:hypothetical protein
MTWDKVYREMTMLRSIKTYLSAAAVVGAAVFGLSPAFAQNPPASLFICAVTAADGGCSNGGGSPAGVVTFTYSNFTDSFVNGLPAVSPTEASEAGSDLPDLGLAKIVFSFSWLGMGLDTAPQTIFFDAPGGGVSAVLNFAYSREGLDLTNVFGYVIASASPVSAAALEADGIVPTGTASASGPFDFSGTDITATFQPGAAVPEASTWAMVLISFAGLGYASVRRLGSRGARA